MKSIIKQATFIGVLAIASLIIQACDGPSNPDPSIDTTAADNNCTVDSINTVTGKAHPAGTYPVNTKDIATTYVNQLKKQQVQSLYELSVVTTRSGFGVIKAVDKYSRKSIILAPEELLETQRQEIQLYKEDPLWRNVTMTCK